MENNGKKIISEGILIAAVPFLGYLTVFIYELGFSNYFGIPYEFIQPSFTGVCLVTAIIIGVLLNVFVVGHLFSVILPIKEGPFLRVIKRVTLPLLVLLFFVFLLGKEWKIYLGSIVIVMIIVAVEFLWPLLTCRDKKTYEEKLIAQEKIEEKFEPEFRRFFDYIDAKFSRQNVSICLVTFLLLVFVYQAGLINARQKEHFWQIENDSKIVLRIYGDNLICADFDINKHIISDSFNIVKRSSEKTLSLKMIKTGKLKTISSTVMIRP